MLVTADDFREQLHAIFAFPGEFLEVNGRMEIGERFRAIKHNYRRKQAMVDAGLSEWFKGDPYEIANWPSIFTPIEYSLWFDIRGTGMDLWPQLPVGRYFVDFGNPVAKIAIECDGKQWHQDKIKDQERDEDLENMGWEVVRIPGWQCNARILTRQEAEEKGIEDYEEWRDLRTPHTSLCMARERLEWAKSSV
jgi:very-short-patch-repair endonuclease